MLQLNVFDLTSDAFDLIDRLPAVLSQIRTNEPLPPSSPWQMWLTVLADKLVQFASRLNSNAFSVEATAAASSLLECRGAIVEFFQRNESSESRLRELQTVNEIQFRTAADWDASEHSRYRTYLDRNSTQLLQPFLARLVGLRDALPCELQPFFDLCQLTWSIPQDFDAWCSQISANTRQRQDRLLNVIKSNFCAVLQRCVSLQPVLSIVEVTYFDDDPRKLEHELSVLRQAVRQRLSEASTVCGIIRHGDEPALLVTASQTVSDMSRCPSAHEGTDSAETAGVTATLLPNGGTYVIITDQASARINEPTTISALTNTANGNEPPESAGAVERQVADPIVNPAPNAVHQRPLDGGENNGSPSGDEPSARARAADEETQDAGVPVTAGERSGAETEALPNGDVPPELVMAADGLIADPAVNAGRHLQPESTVSPRANGVDRSAATSEKLRDGVAPSHVQLRLTPAENAVFLILFYATETLTIEDIIKEVNKTREGKKRKKDVDEHS